MTPAEKLGLDALRVVGLLLLARPEAAIGHSLEDLRRAAVEELRAERKGGDAYNSASPASYPERDA